MESGTGPLGQSGIEPNFVYRDTPPPIVVILTCIIISLLIFAAIYDIGHQPVKQYQLTTYNLDGSRSINVTDCYETHEFAGTYRFRLKNNKYSVVPIKNTNIVELEK